MIITPALYKKNLIENGHSEILRTYRGSMKDNVAMKEVDKADLIGETILDLKSNSYENTDLYNSNWNEIENLVKKYKTNSATFSEDDYYSLVDKLRIDVSRRRFEYPDVTSFIDMVVTNENFSKSVTLDEFLPYAAAFKEYGMNNDAVSLIDQKYGGTKTVTHQGYAVGWKDTLDNALFNDIFSLQRINEAVARGFVAKRNDLSAGEIVGTTFNASQQVAASTTSGASSEELMYETIDSAIEKLTNLKDPQTDQLIVANEIYCMCNPGDARRINRAINGQLNASKGRNSNRTPLEIAQIVPYFGDTLYVGKEKITYSGVTKGKAYLYVPGQASWTLVKRGLTQEVGRGSVLHLSTQEYAWYFVQTSYRREFYGSSDATILSDKGTGYGYIVEVTLP